MEDTAPIFRLRELRLDAGLSQAQLGELAGVRQATISLMESRPPRLLDIAMLGRLAAALGVHPARILGWEPPRVAKPKKPKAPRGKAGR